MNQHELALTIEQYEAQGYRYHHTATAQGYVSRRIAGYITPYNGRFGKGYIVHTPLHTTTSYHCVEYYIKED